jgi:hypothetical protein
MLDFFSHQGNQIKITLTVHLTPVRMAVIKKIKTNKYWEACGKKRNPYIDCGNVN